MGIRTASLIQNALNWCKLKWRSLLRQLENFKHLLCGFQAYFVFLSRVLPFHNRAARGRAGIAVDSEATDLQLHSLTDKSRPLPGRAT